MTNVWIFESTGTAYDSVQTQDDIATGDILVIPSEGVVGVAYTWPIAISENIGKLHTTIDAPEIFLTRLVVEGKTFDLARTIELMRQPIADLQAIGRDYWVEWSDAHAFFPK